MTESQENELADMITDVAIDYANGRATDFRIAAKAAVAFVTDATRAGEPQVTTLEQVWNILMDQKQPHLAVRMNDALKVLDSAIATRDTALTDAQIDAATAAWFHYSQDYTNDDYRARMRAAIAASATQTNGEPQ